MKKIFTIFVFSAFILGACSKEDGDEIIYPSELVPYTEFKDSKLFVGGNEQSTTGIEPETIFDAEELGKDFYYIKLKSDNELTLAFDGTENNSFDTPYAFHGDSMIIVTEYLEEGRFFLGKGSRKSLSKECGAFMFYGYQMKNGQKVDVNKDEIVNEMDKVKVTALKNKFITGNDVLLEMGYTSMSQLEVKDSILVYNYTLRFVKDLNGDRLFTDVDR